MLSTPAGTAFLPVARDRHIYIVWMALVWAGMFAGFTPDFPHFLAEAPPPPFILNLHGAVYFLWLVVVSVQIGLVELRNPALHRTLGWWLVGLSVVLVPLGVVASMVDMARSASHPDYKPQFLGLEFQAMIVFPILLALAIHKRRDLAAHKRLMVLLMICILDPGTARAFGYFSPIHPEGPLGWWLNYFWGNASMVLAMMGWDLWRHGRVHPALLTGAAVLAAGEVAAVTLEFSPWWHTTSAGLVTAWGWTG